MARRRVKVPAKVLEQAKSHAKSAAMRSVAADGSSEKRAQRPALVTRATKDKLVKALKKLHPMD